ncbi:polysaccharide pyruvyl transferase family protein [Methanosarcina sp. Z-7115]|uniref:Polysaccharide pyruvyl transferase family protein n=1 Tax=Methanosarcina baikalica TaxID=3073890 RepID=A0ABU2D268_9EURY|nr:polysaccharide pyruvyl transferase family protein [Methanosarcina sp. Z-7115]MDR7666073.1 polysaccharide pyruvyl transferase family protein [Methanosarcina sp. Z-7115]
MTKILVLHAGVSNKGSQALVFSLIDTLRKYIPNSQFTFMGTEIGQEDIPIKKQLAIKPLKNICPWIYLFECFIFRMLTNIGISIPISKKSDLYYYYDSDIIVNTGGDHLSGEKFGLSSLLNISYAILLGKPVVLYAESLGYYKNPIFNFIAKYVLNRTKLITVRESISKKYLIENKINNPKVYLTADPAFNLEPSPLSTIFEILSNEGIDINKRPIIGINSSGLISRFRKSDSENSSQEIVSIFAKVIDSLIEELDANIIMVPHVYSEKVSDKRSILEIYNIVENKSNVKLILNEYNAKELKGIIGICDLFVGARMHATIASTSMYVPTVGIAYSHKMHGVIGQMLKQEDYIIDVNDLNYNLLKSKIYDCWSNRENIQKDLKYIIPQIKEKSSLNGKYVKDLLNSL